MAKISLKEILIDCDLDPYSYSGRNMFGTRCVAIDVENPVDAVVGIFETIMYKLQDILELDESTDTSHIFDLVEKLRDSKTDSMGLGMVLYWPHIEWTED